MALDLHKVKLDSILIKTAKCKALDFIVASRSFIQVCLIQRRGTSKSPANESLLPGRINELSHNSQEENLGEGWQKGGMASIIIVRLLKMVAL
jgi:hypothetical protein